MPFNLDVLTRIQEQGKIIQDAIMVRDYGSNEEGRASSEHPRFGKDQHPSKRSKSRRSQDRHQQINFSNHGCGTGPNSNAKRKQVSGILKTSVISDNQSKYVTTEPRQNFILPPYQMKGKKQER